MYTFYLSNQTTSVPLSHASISQPHHLAHSPHRWPGREAEAGAGCQLTLSGRRSPSNWRKTVISALSVSSVKIAAAPQPHLTCLFLLWFLRAAVASPLNGRIQSATERCPPPPSHPHRREKLCGNDGLENVLRSRTSSSSVIVQTPNLQQQIGGI